MPSRFRSRPNHSFWLLSKLLDSGSALESVYPLTLHGETLMEPPNASYQLWNGPNSLWHGPTAPRMPLNNSCSLCTAPYPIWYGPINFWLRDFLARRPCNLFL